MAYSPADFRKIEAALAPLDMDMRIDLAKASHFIADSCASNMKTVNTIRNKLAHYQPKLGWGIEHVQELFSANAFEQCTNKGSRAFREAVDGILKRMEEVDPYKPDNV